MRVEVLSFSGSRPQDGIGGRIGSRVRSPRRFACGKAQIRVGLRRDSPWRRSGKRARFVLAEFLLHSYRVIHRLTGSVTINSQPLTHVLLNASPLKVGRLKQRRTATGAEIDGLPASIVGKTFKGEL